MPKGIYPFMPIPDIISSFEAWGMSIPEERLLRPTPEFVDNVFWACLTQATGITPEDLLEPAQNASSISVIEEKDIYIGALKHNLLVHHLSRFAAAAHIEDFNAIDLMKPEKDRTLILLSAFINFIRFTEQLCDPFIKDLSERSEALLVEHDKVADDLDKIQKQIGEFKAKMAEDEPLCEELRAENKQLGTDVYHLKVTLQEARDVVEELKAQKRTLIERQRDLSMEMEAISDANRRLRGRIVQSPERVKRTISTMATGTIQHKKTVGSNEAKMRDLQAKINALMTIEQDLLSCIDQLQVLDKEIISLQELEKDLGELKDQLDDKKIERNELQLKQERVAKQLENAHAKLASTQDHVADKKVQSERTMQRLQREYDEMDGERKENELQLAEVRKEATEVEEKMAEHLKASEEELNGLLKEYWALRHATEVYMETLANSLNMKIES